MINICHWILKCSPYTTYLFWSYDCTVWYNKFFLIYLIAGLDAFRTFLKSEFSEENFELWLACEDFKKTESAEKIASKAKMIYSEFIEADAPEEVGEIFHNSEYLSANKSAPHWKARSPSWGKLNCHYVFKQKMLVNSKRSSLPWSSGTDSANILKHLLCA